MYLDFICIYSDKVAPVDKVVPFDELTPADELALFDEVVLFDIKVAPVDKLLHHSYFKETV